MALNPYFNNHDYKPTQDLMEDLVEESIKINGINVYYIPRRFVDLDQIFGEDSSSFFKDAIQIEMYMDNYSGFAGEREIISKFGLEIRDTLSLVVSKRRFQKESAKFPVMSDRPVEISNPMEGDLIWYPFTKALFEIKFVDQTKDFFMLGRKAPYFYELELEKFKYSQEIIRSGINEIDQVVTDYAYTLTLNIGAGNANNYSISEIVYQSPDSTYANATTVALVQDWLPTEQELFVTNIGGTFTNGQVIIGQSSNARYTLISYDTLLNPSTHENYDNHYIANSATSIIDFSENNPFGPI
jgi:hypothetical protein